jgi:hypothetical protein
MKSPQSKVKDILSYLQILHQSEEISTEQKNQFVKAISDARRTNDFSQLNSSFRVMAYGTTMPDIVDALIELTTN